LLDVLIAEGALDAARVARLLAAKFGMEFVELGALRVPADVLALVPRAIAARYRLMPLGREGHALRVAVSDPLDTDGVDSLGHLLKLTIVPVVASAEDISHAIDRSYGWEAGSLDQLLTNISGAEADVVVDPGVAPATAGKDATEDSDAPIIKLVHSIIIEAIQRRASDIHLEPLEKRFRIRYRIDGVLNEVENPPKRLQLAIISRLKIMANISIAEKRIPQDGRIQITVAGRTLDTFVIQSDSVTGGAHAGTEHDVAWHAQDLGLDVRQTVSRRIGGAFPYRLEASATLAEFSPSR